MLNTNLFTIRNFIVIGAIAIATKAIFGRCCAKLDKSE